MDLIELEQQVQLQEDILEIENLQKIYGYYFDNGMYQAVVDLFSPHPESVEITDHGVFRGRQGVERMYHMMLGTPRPEGVFFEIMQSQGVVDVAPDGKTAAGRWYTPSFECRNFGGAKRQTWQFGIYDNRYVKEKGRWYFFKLHWNLTYLTSFDSGFLKQPKLADTPTPEADAPATAYHPYPSGYHVPYAFKHPVTGK
jgi:hypothetical protein